MDQFETKAACFQAPMGERVLLTELSEEFSLPDYQPEMKRLLRVKATVMPPDRYVGGGHAECAGTVEYAILYAGNDGCIYSTVQSGGYRMVMPVELPAEAETGANLLCDAAITAEQVSGRVVAPRRVSVKCRLRSKLGLYGARTVGCEPASREQLERLCGELECAALYTGMGEELQLADEILCEANRDLRVISAEGAVFLTECAAGSGCVQCGGELALRLLVARETEEGTESVSAITRRIPFRQTVDAEGAEVNCQACAEGFCRTLAVTVEEGRILCEASVCLLVRAARNVSVPYLRDVYSTGNAAEVSFGRLQLPRLLSAFNGNFTLNTTVPAEEAGIRREHKLVDLAATAVSPTWAWERGRLRVNGTCRLCSILSDGEELGARESEIPFHYEAEIGREAPTSCEISVEVVSCRGKLDGERLGVDAELALAVRAYGESEIQAVKEIRIGEAMTHLGGDTLIYYPEKRDTLWSVAKHYRRSMSELARRNALPDAPAADSAASLEGVKYLLIVNE